MNVTLIDHGSLIFLKSPMMKRILILLYFPSSVQATLTLCINPRSLLVLCLALATRCRHEAVLPLWISAPERVCQGLRCIEAALANTTSCIEKIHVTLLLRLALMCAQQQAKLAVKQSPGLAFSLTPVRMLGRVCKKSMRAR